MARIARLVIPGFYHHIIQRGNRKQKVFFSDDDKIFYLNTLASKARQYGITCIAYCLMNNHVHLIAIPEYEDSFSKGIGETHKKYTRTINLREGWSGYLWQGRFLSFPLADKHLHSAIRYVENNPVRIGLVEKAEDYRWSSARAHVNREGDVLLADCHKTLSVENWAALLTKDDHDDDYDWFRKCSKTGRPLGDDTYVVKLEEITGRIIKKVKPGPRRNK